MIVVCKKAFRDLETKGFHEVGERFEVTAERLSAINSTQYGQLVEPIDEKPSETVSEPEKATKEQPKPRRRGRKPKTEE